MDTRLTQGPLTFYSLLTFHHQNPLEMAYGSQTVSFLVKEHIDKRAARQANDGHGFQIFKQLLNHI